MNAKYICVRSAKKCDGFRMLNGRRVPCPLSDSCLYEYLSNPEYRETAYDYPCSTYRGHARWLARSHDEKMARDRRYAELNYIFGDTKQKSLERQRKHRAAEREKQGRERDRPQITHRSRKKVRDVLPCGEDCENCPYDSCIYTDADMDELLRQNERARRKPVSDRYYATHRDEILARQSDRYYNNLDAERERHRKTAARWRERHRETTRQKAAARREKNRDAINARARELRQLDPEKYRAREREWYAKHRDKLREAALERYRRNADEINRRARERRAEKRKERGEMTNGKS